MTPSPEATEHATEPATRPAIGEDNGHATDSAVALAPAAPAPRLRHRKPWMTTAASLAGLVIGWELAARLGLARLGVLAGPSEVIGALAARPDLYLNAILVTGDVALRGWLWGGALGLITALLFVQIAMAERLLIKVALALFCIPEVALLPILQVSLDPDTARVSMAAIAVYFTMVVSTMLGLRSTPGQSRQLVHAWGGGAFSVLRFIRLRSGLPGILTGLQIGAPSALTGAILGEFMGANAGLGVILVGGLSTLSLDRVWAVALIITLLGSLVYLAIGAVIRAVAPWSTASMDQVVDVSAGASGAGRLRRTANGIGWSLLSIGVLIGAWWGFIAILDLSPFFAKTPWDVVVFLGEWENAAVVLTALGTTLGHAVIGFAVGLTTGLIGATLFMVLPALEIALAPVAVALRSVPIVVIIPLLILALGRGLVAVATIAAIISFFPTLSTVTTALRQTPRGALDLMRSYGASRLAALWRIQLPFALPAVFASARLAAPAAVLGVTLAEWLATGNGIGNLIARSRSYSQFDQLWAAAAVLTVVSIVVYGLISSLERRVLVVFR